MKQTNYKIAYSTNAHLYPLLFLFFLITSCKGQNQPASVKEDRIKSAAIPITEKSDEIEESRHLFTLPYSQMLKPDVASQIGEYVREVFQDRKGNFWFGTLVRGVAHYDGTSLRYFSKEEGLVGNQINGIAEDQTGNLWFATTEGVSKYDPSASQAGRKNFTNLTTEDGLTDNNTWSILADSKGNIWVGTMAGVSRYDGSSFSNFPIPKAEIENVSYLFSTDLVWSMIEDKQGNIWFGTDGVGVCKYDPSAEQEGGNSFSHFTKKDGLCNNDVGSIVEDHQGNLWFGSLETRVPESAGSFKYGPSGDGGLSRYDGSSFQQFSGIKGISNNDIRPVYVDKKGVLWIASKHHGVYRYDPTADEADGPTFTNYMETGGIAPNNCIQSILEDNDGEMWFGFSGGLFRFNGNSFINVTKEGPWK